MTDFEASYAKRERGDRGDFEASAMLMDRSRLTTDEEAVGGKVKWSVYLDLFRGLGLRYAFFILIFIIAFHFVDNFGNIWLSTWTDDSDLANFTSHPANSSEREDKNGYYISVYTGLGFLQTIFVLVYSALLQLRHIAASRKLHRELLESVIHAPMSFFDTTPMGRILNRFSQDVEILDNDIFLELEVVSDHGFKALATIIIISYNLPIFLVVVVPVLVLYYLLQQFYIRTSCQLRRLASNNRSPVYAHFSETLSGVAVIRAYREQDRFIHNSEQKVDKFQGAIVVSNAVNKWVQTSLEILSCVVIGTAVIFTVEFRDQLSAGVVGLTVTYALNIAINLSITTEVLGNLETHAVSVERIREYSVIKSEADWNCLEDARATQGEWPWSGCIQFVNYSIRYREGLDLVLKDLNCTIQGGEKVGLVGRTGAGKSSMVLSIFRLVEAAVGKILIDGVDISKLGLHALRRHLTILPQEPVLFAGSLRMNLDPFGEHTDPALWTALDHAHLRPYVESLPQKLDHEVGEGGENMSMGQRQLVCLARTLLRKTKILVLDEATAAVDMETDDLIQKTIRSEFSGCTILTIAHRLNTVMDYDRIMVLDSGRLVEFNSPTNLLANPASIFYSMAKDAGLVSVQTS